ncbi:MAG: hypothetical protein M1832_001890 [Thelocarpon impressellum]|nr:MAG: hypothetical protein M1832_001890 [Thelocarpon impressellum]
MADENNTGYDNPSRAARRERQDDLAYGEYDDEQGGSAAEGDRGIIGDTINRFRHRHNKPQGDYSEGPSYSPDAQPQYSSSQNVTQLYQPQLYSQQQRPQAPPGGHDHQPTAQASSKMSFLGKLTDKVQTLSSDVAKTISKSSGPGVKHSHTHFVSDCDDGVHDNLNHRYRSFAPDQGGNDVKWYVDGCTYMWAVSRALETAQESIWILDWWLSPELYLRRPPSKFEAYRLDRMLLTAAQRGVKVNIIVYKEVTQALTRKYLSPTLPGYLHSLLPPSTDPVVSLLSGLGIAATFTSLEEVESQNPLMAPPVTVCSSHTKHHLEDLHRNICVFRHPDHLPDAQSLHSSFASGFQSLTLDQKFNGAALKGIYGMNDDVVLYWAHHEKLLLIDGNIAFMGGLDLCFGRWDTTDHPIADAHPGNLDNILFPGQDFNNARVMDFDDVPHWQNNKLDRTTSSRMGWSDIAVSLRGPVVEDLAAHFADRWNFIYDEKYSVRKDERYSRLGGRQHMSDMLPQRHSIANAYISVIEKSQHFIYIENQFFITATHDAQKPIRNKIGAAIVDRILRAATSGQKYKVIVVIPAVPGFAGDLQDEASLGTRAIMEFQYNSINRGGHSIMEAIGKAGFNPMDYIRFYNLRNYDRVNSSAAMTEAEQKSGVSYEDARKQHDDVVGAGFGGRGEETGAGGHGGQEQYQQYQQAAQNISRRQGLGDGKWDSVSECYMLNGPDLRSVPWENGDIKEMDAFVSEELYVHSKVLIADDRIVICGSANLNDRSQLGEHDSEIAIIVEDPTPLDSYMDGRPWRASKFAATLRRELFRKHLGLIPPQDPARPDQNFEPVGIPNRYDLGSREDAAVVDPLSDNFLNFWNSTAARNTEVFGKVFHAVPHDAVRNWKQYDDFYTRFFHEQGKDKDKQPARYKWGHVVAEEFPPGAEGVAVVKELLSSVRGTLVEMPLLFLIEEDIAKEGLGLNTFTEDVYT